MYAPEEEREDEFALMRWEDDGGHIYDAVNSDDNDPEADVPHIVESVEENNDGYLIVTANRPRISDSSIVPAIPTRAGRAYED